MNKALITSELFEGITSEEAQILIHCIGAASSYFAKNDTVVLAGKRTDNFGIVLSGNLQIVHDDYYGNRSILSNVEPGELFAESFVFAKTPIPVTVISVSDSETMTINSNKLISNCQKACGFHNRLIMNLISIVSRKNIELTRKIQLVSKRLTRDKLLSYLSYEAEKNSSSTFSIPFDRQALADYLGVERSAMSAELSRMRDDGLIEYHKNSFKIMK
ncbi:MAG: Crp/Fnr family transcriptional regulator [Eubacteriales bacterium]|nr:Crp/Fnr family transcriptional regulator [Eubacteriales bacterium]MDD4475563.1 Crp/Fnr family transcriptional regulator [Eubacteriales bacterium]